jgi:hypothetical protein
MSDTPLHDQLANLEAELADAKERRNQAKDDMRGQDAAREITAALAIFHADVRYHKPEATPADQFVDRGRELTADLAAQIAERGLIAKPVQSADGGTAVQLFDPTVSEGFDAAHTEAVAIERRLVAFKTQYAHDLNTERRLAETRRLREQIDAGEITLAEAVSPRRTPAGVFTTEDLPSGRAHNRSAARAAA